MTKNKSAEDCLREAFTEELIKTGLYPDALLRPRIYKAMNEFATQEVDAYKARLRDKVMDISKYDEDLKMKVIELIDKTDLT